MFAIQFSLQSCKYETLIPPPPGSCAGPTERILAMRANISLFYHCAVNVSRCPSKSGCNWCCPEQNRFGGGNPQCSTTSVCENYLCIPANNSIKFQTQCSSNLECRQLKCVDGMCQQCSHGQQIGQQTCVDGHLVGGYAFVLFSGTILLLVLAVLLLLIGAVSVMAVLKCKM